EGYEYGSFHFLEPSFLHNYTDSTCIERKRSYDDESSLHDFICCYFVYRMPYDFQLAERKEGGNDER
ncbi:hypothetical protein ABNF65_09030, partial [Paenibacillus larvae]